MSCLVLFQDRSWGGNCGVQERHGWAAVGPSGECVPNAGGAHGISWHLLACQRLQAAPTQPERPGQSWGSRRVDPGVPSGMCCAHHVRVCARTKVRRQRGKHWVGRGLGRGVEGYPGCRVTQHRSLWQGLVVAGPGRGTCSWFCPAPLRVYSRLCDKTQSYKECPWAISFLLTPSSTLLSA